MRFVFKNLRNYSMQFLQNMPFTLRTIPRWIRIPSKSPNPSPLESQARGTARLSRVGWVDHQPDGLAMLCLLQMTPPFLGLNLTRGGVGICMRPLAEAIDDGLLQLQQSCSLRDFHFRQCPLLLFSP